MYVLAGIYIRNLTVCGKYGKLLLYMSEKLEGRSINRRLGTELSGSFKDGKLLIVC